MGGVLAGVYAIGLIQGPVDVRIEGSHLAYQLGMRRVHREPDVRVHPA